MSTVGKGNICRLMRSNIYCCYLVAIKILRQDNIHHTLAHDSSIITTTAACCWGTWTVIQGGFRPSALHPCDGWCQFRGAKETTTNSGSTCGNAIVYHYNLDCQSELNVYCEIRKSHFSPLGENPNSLQTTKASLSFHESKQMVWYPPPLQISTLPLLRSSPM